MIISSYCTYGNCVAVERRGAAVAVWCTRCPAVVLIFDAEEWSAFVAGVKAGEFDLSTAVTGPESAVEPREGAGAGPLSNLAPPEG